jgi:hypothetical protein
MPRIRGVESLVDGRVCDVHQKGPMDFQKTIPNAGMFSNGVF